MTDIQTITQKNGDVYCGKIIDGKKQGFGIEKRGRKFFFGN